MLSFYYSIDSSALAAHIFLEEVGADYEAVEVSIPDGAHKTPEFLALSPKGRIPILRTPEGVVSENPAILEYIATIHPEAEMLPQGAFTQAQARSLTGYLATTMQVAFAHQNRGARWVQNDASLQDMKAMVPGNLRACAAYLEQALDLAPWALGAQYSYCDPYLFLSQRWLQKSGVTTEEFPRLSAYRRAMLDRPAVQKVLKVHGLEGVI